jgi:tetratricopeptide (TPR) repeat protein
MYEDVEIMRRILNRKLSDAYGGAPNYGIFRRSVLMPQNANVTGDQAMAYFLGGTLSNPTVSSTEYNKYLWSQLLQPDLNKAYLDTVNQPANALSNLSTNNFANWAEFVYFNGSQQRLPLTTEGAYLKGHGVVFTMTLPLHDKREQEATALQKLAAAYCAKCHEQTAAKGYEEAFRTFQQSADKAAKPEPHAPDAWEQTRREVRGVKEEPKKDPPPPPAKKLTVCGPSTVAEMVLRTLAENGKHFERLAPDESLTVIITFRPWNGPGVASNDNFWLDLGFPASAAANKAGSGVTMVDIDNDGRADLWVSNTATGVAGLFLNNGDGTFTNEPLKSAAGSNSAPAPAKNDQEEVKKAVDKAIEYLKRNQSAGPRDYELLGDLHMKQGRFEEAIRAYEKAVQENPSSVALRSKHLEALKSHVDVTQKQLEADKPKLEEMRKQLLEAAQEYANALGGKKKEAASPAPPPPPPPLPAKLTVSAPKKLLDLVGQGKITFEEFQKAATIEYFQPTPAERK